MVKQHSMLHISDSRGRRNSKGSYRSNHLYWWLWRGPNFWKVR